jgi:hypothetical protein
MTAVLFCKITGIRHICAGALRGVSQSFTTKDGIFIWALNECPFSSFEIWSDSCFLGWTVPLCPGWNMSEIADTFRDEWLATIPRKEIPDDTVVLSIRGSDVFPIDEHLSPTNYWQPPCDFYTKIQRRFNKSIVVSTDFRNPCVKVAQRNGAKFVHESGIDDFATLVYAKNLALSRSSFTKAAMYMSPFHKNFYVFEGDPESINDRYFGFMERFLEHGSHWNCRASKAYQRLIIPDGWGNWTANATQRELLLTDRCRCERVDINKISWNPRLPRNHDVGMGYFVFN